MGAQISRTFRRAPPLPAEPNPTLTSNSNSSSTSTAAAAADLSSYEAACRADPDLQTFDSNLQLRTSAAINSISVNLDLRSLREVTEYLLESNQEVVKIILQNKRHIWRDREFADLIDDYFANSLLTLDLCAALDSCLNSAARIESSVNLALRRFAAGNFANALAELSNFGSESADPFTEEFLEIFARVYAKQAAMLEKLRSRKRSLDSKLGKLKAWRKVSNVIFVVTFAAVLVCSVVAAAVAAPPLVTALAAAAAPPLGSMGRWLNSLWKKCETDLRKQREIISSMEIGTYVVIQDLANISALVERFRVKLEELAANADFAAAEAEEAAATAATAAAAEVREKLEEFMKTVRDLSEYANKCSQETRMARVLILRRIVDHSNDEESEIGMFS